MKCNKSFLFICRLGCFKWLNLLLRLKAAAVVVVG